MKNYVKCKACGYIMEASRLGDKCPACGVPAKQFEPYDDKVSEKRRKIMDLHIHPIIVHIPQAFVSFLVLIGLVLLVVPGFLRPLLLHTATVLGVVLPFSVAAAIGAGLFDGKLRFRRLNTEVLQRKIVIGSTFFVISVAEALLVLFVGLEVTAALAVFTLLCAVGLGAAVVLGLLGTPLFFAKFPG
ncbi:MAG TPA: hypothetical protein VMC79_00785 [Rectinemataceae bacterium]|nr:hypothetical protein [Rectinemataceae bacterium]